MQDLYALKNEYAALCRAMEALLHDVAIIEMLTQCFGDAVGHKIQVAMMTEYKNRVIYNLAARISILLPIEKEDLQKSLQIAADEVYQVRLEPAKHFGQWMANSLSSNTHVFYVQKSQEEFVQMRILLDKHMRRLLGKFFDEQVREVECISVPVLFKIDLQRKYQSYADEVRKGYKPRKVSADSC